MASFLELHHVNVARGDNHVLHDINLSVAAGEHMQMIGDPLATAIAAKFPTQFPNS